MILVIDMNYKKDSLGYDEFVLPIISIAETLVPCETKHYLDLPSKELNECEKIILSGTTLEDNVTLSHPEKFQWLRQIEKPVLGICAGMQTIGMAFNLKLLKCVEIGMTDMTTLKENPLLPKAFRAYSLHNYSVEVDGDFEALAESENCVQAIRHKRKPIFGLLFHPEVRNEDILKRFIQLKQ